MRASRTLLGFIYMNIALSFPLVPQPLPCSPFFLSVISLYDSEENQTTNGYYRQFMECFSRDEAAGETRICDPMQLLNLLLSQNELVFRWLMDIKNAQEQHGSGPPATGSDGKPEVNRKTHTRQAPHRMIMS